MDKIEFVNKIHDLLFQADSLETAEESNILLAKARDILQKYLRDDEPDPESWYVAGLTFYESFAIEINYGKEAERCLSKAILLDPEHQFARLFLGHYYYDIGSYEEALARFEKVQEGYFISVGKFFRVLKLHELILCCKLRLNDQDLTINNFIHLIKELDQSEPEDVPVPLEMADCLVKTKESTIWQRVDRVSLLKLFIAFIEKQGYTQALRGYIDCF